MRLRRSRRTVWLEAMLGYLLTCYIALVLATTWELAGRSLQTLILSFDVKKMTGNPLHFYYNKTSLQFLIAGTVVYIMVYLNYSFRGNFMPGKEFGSSKWGNVREMDKRLSDQRDGYNIILSENLRLSLDGDKTNLNSHVLVIGGSGAGKSFYFTASNFLSHPECSFFVTDPKGELLRNLGAVIKEMGYHLQVLNLLQPELSDHYNPFVYLKGEEDVNELVENLLKNTTEKENTNSDPFWDKAEGMLYRVLFHYIRLELAPPLRNMRSFLKMLSDIKITDKKEPSKFNILMENLAKEKGERHPAVKEFRKFDGPADTLRSVLMCAHTRLDFLDNDMILDLMDSNTIDIASMGNGINNDPSKKTFTFCVIPDNKKIYNPIVGMLYTQAFNELYYQADILHDGKLPIHVCFWFDEFANVALPTDFVSLLTTMRSRNISSTIIIQNLAQIKEKYGQYLWETIPGNCDTLVYLGGNEPSTHKYVVDLLGKQTIDKKSHGESKGRNGSSSQNVDGLGRELLDVSELRRMKRKDCLILISGEDPVIDRKYRTFLHKLFSRTGWKGNQYIHTPSSGKKIDQGSIIPLSIKEIKNYEELQQEGKTQIIEMSAEEFLMLDKVAFPTTSLSHTNKEIEFAEEEYVLEDTDIQEEEDNGDSLTKRVAAYQYTKEQIKEAENALNHNVPENEMLEWFYPDVPASNMRNMWSDK